MRRVRAIPTVYMNNWTKKLAKGDSLRCDQANCTFTSIDRNQMANHFRECIIAPGNKYDCISCVFVPTSYDEVLEHAKFAHAKKCTVKGNVDFEDSGSEADIAEESSESEGPSGDDETIDNNSGEVQTDEEHCNTHNVKDTKRKRPSREKFNASIDTGPDRLGTESFLFFFFQSIIIGCSLVLAKHTSILRAESSFDFFAPAVEWTSK